MTTFTIDETNNLKLGINSNEPAFKDYVLSFGGSDVGELLLMEISIVRLANGKNTLENIRCHGM